MTLQGHTLTTADVVKIRDGIQARWPDWPPEDVLRSTRTEVHAALQLQLPAPCTALTAAMLAARNRREPLTHSEIGEQHGHQLTQVTPEQHAAYSRAIASGDPNARNCKDAHHYTQMVHGTSLWAETDRLCAEAGVK